MAELDPPRLAAMMASSAWGPQLTSDQRQRAARSRSRGTAIHRQSVNQALQVPAREGLLTVDYGSIRIRDRARLRRYGG